MTPIPDAARKCAAAIMAEWGLSYVEDAAIKDLILADVDLMTLFRKRESVKDWLNTPVSELGESPMSHIAAGDAESMARLRQLTEFLNGR